MGAFAVHGRQPGKDPSGLGVLDVETAVVIAVVADRERPNEFEVGLPEQAAKANLFSAVAHGKATPVDVLHAEYLAQLQVNRTRADDERALRLLRDWCRREDVPFKIERFDAKRAWAFADALPKLSGNHAATCNKYLGWLGGYRQFLAHRADAATSNIFHGVTVRAPKPKADEKERTFKDSEVATLLAGPATRAMQDLMRIDALSGARLDAIVHLAVGEPGSTAT